MNKITSKSNPLVKKLNKIANQRKFRESENIFLIEGWRSLKNFVDNKHEFYEIEFINNGKSALWILDGQHRTHGLAKHANTQNEKIPVVLLIKNSAYVMEFLAQIFTEVTTGAKDLEHIHKNWMEYSFGLGGVYKKGLSTKIPPSPQDRAMLTVIELTTNSNFDGQHNEFYNQIKFNPN